MTWPLSCLISQPLFPLWIAPIAFLSMMKLCPCFAKCFAILHWDVLDAWYLQKLLLLSKTCPFASNCFQSWPLFTSSRNVLIQMHAWLRPYFHSDFFFFFHTRSSYCFELYSFLTSWAFCFIQLWFITSDCKEFWMKSSISASPLPATAPQHTARRNWESICAKMYQYIQTASN